MKNHKIVKQTVYSRDEKFDYASMYIYLCEISNELDIATPILLKVHIFNYAKFNHVKFNASDFVEKVNFDYLLIENITEK